MRHQGYTSFCLKAHARCCLQPAHTFTSGSGEKISCVRHSDELSELDPKDWPNLAMILLHELDSKVYLDSRRLLKGRWHLDVQLCFVKDCDGCTAPSDYKEHCSSPQCEFVLLISLFSIARPADFDLSPRLREILSQHVRIHRSTTTSIIVGPQQDSLVSCGAQTASSALWLPDSLWSCFSRVAWPKVYRLDMHNQQCSLACAQDLVRCNFPLLEEIVWCAGKLSAPICAVLGQACLSMLTYLSLCEQDWNVATLPEPLQASLPCFTVLDVAYNSLDLMCLTALSTGFRHRILQELHLDGNALGEEGVSALGLGHWETLQSCSLRHCSISSHAAVTCLARVHFPKLGNLCLTGNRFEKGAVACLSGAQRPTLTCVMLGSQDLDEDDCGVLGISKSGGRWVRPGVREERGYVQEQEYVYHYSTKDCVALPTVTIYLEL